MCILYVGCGFCLEVEIRNIHFPPPPPFFFGLIVVVFGEECRINWVGTLFLVDEVGSLVASVGVIDAAGSVE